MNPGQEQCRIDFIISGLGGGGAEKMMFKLLSKIDRTTFAPRVFSLTSHHEITPTWVKQYAEMTIPVAVLGMHRRRPNFGKIAHLIAAIRKNRPHIVQTWMYHADLIGGISAKLAGSYPVVWNIRHSNLDANLHKQMTILVARTCARLSRFLPEKVICCAEVAKTIHAAIGYDPAKLVVIPNGFDLEVLKPESGAHGRLCRELGIAEESLLVGLVARFDRQKDHRGFIRAATAVKSAIPAAHFVLCGDDVTWDNRDLAEAVAASGAGAAFHLLGHRGDVQSLNAAFDVACSSSSGGEGFPNTIGEAMGCATPCVVTDVGDSARIVGATGRVVPAKDAAAFAQALCDLLQLPPEARRELGRKARERIQVNFSLDAVTRQYESLYLDLFAARRRQP